MTNNEAFDLHQFEKLERLSNSGSYDVFKVKQTGTDNFYMAKILITSSNESDNPLKREIDNGSKYDIPSFIKYIGYSPLNFENKKRPCIVVEFCPNGSLNKIIGLINSGKSVSDWNDTKKLICLYGIAYGLSVLHSQNIAFKNLNPSNVFLDEYFYPKIHGFSRASPVTETTPESDINENISPSYMAPEIINSEPFQLKSDVYSFGILGYEIVSGKGAYGKSPNIMKIIAGARPQFDKSVPQPYQNLFARCWSESIEERPTFSEILELLKTDPSFITENVDQEEFNKYVDLLNAKTQDLPEDEKLLKDGINLLQKNKKKAFDCFKNAAEKGNIKAMNYCGIMLLNGQDVPYNEEEAREYLKAAADSDDIEAMNNYGYLLLQSKAKDDKASDYFKKAADKGSIDGMLNYGHLLYCGDDNSLPDKKEALKYFKMASNKKNVDGMYYYALMLKNGEGVEKPDLKKALKLFKQAADDKENPKAEAMLEYALLLIDEDADIGVPHNAKDSLKYLKKSLNKDNIDAMYNYAYILYNGLDDVQINKKESSKYYQKSAEKGQLKAMNEFALLLQNDEIEDENKDELMLKYYKLAADFGCVDAMYNYGWILFNGIGIDSSYEKALPYFKKAADFGNVDAMYKYATMMKYGEGAPKNKKEAAEYFKKAADGGSIDAMNSYALMLFKDDEITSNDEEALKYFKMAVDHGHANAMNNYGEMLLNGRGTEQNKKKAIQYFKMAADLDDQDGIHNYKNAH